MKLVSFLPDVLLIAGAASLSFGAWLAWPPAGFMVGGSLLLMAGVKIARLG